MKPYDVVIVGGGLVGLATAFQVLSQAPHTSLLLVEKESRLANHQSGHNSGVIHAGIYYRPGSQKALNCRKGVELLLDYCRQKGVSFETCGKLIVATDAEELLRLDELQRRAFANQVPGVQRIGPEGIREHEPHCRGLEALWSPSTGIIHYPSLAEALAYDIRQLGGEIRLECPFEEGLTAKAPFRLRLGDQEVLSNFVINCGGLQADRVARMLSAQSPPSQILPFRGEYYVLRPEREGLVKGLIYPVPDPRFPFLGVHLTRMLGGGVEAGPNAVLATSREGYSKMNFSRQDMYEMSVYPGFWRLAKRYWRMGMAEVYRSFSKAAFLRSLQRFVPELQAGDLRPGGAGVRAQLVQPDGTLHDDFCFHEDPGALHVLNAPSPGATSCLSIGRTVSERYFQRL